MVRSHPVSVVCAVALALAVPSAVAAGPIEWEVSAHLARVGGAGGPMSFLLTDEYIGGGATIHEQTFSRLASDGPHTGWGWQSFRIGSLVPEGPSYDPLHYAAGTFGIAVSLTDAGSGKTGTVTFAGRGWEQLGVNVDWFATIESRRAFAELTGETEQTLTLGDTEYHVGLRAVNRDGVVDFYADVQAGAVAATPEPTTLALAALGLGAVGLARRRSGLNRSAGRG
jgi:hypothetical protein